jgi:ElaB/YqjD/DUF883 family membrane-anchored ribosome-binding protein
MATATDADIKALQHDIEQLRADFAKLAGTTRDVLGNGVAAAGHKAQASVEQAWGDIKQQAQQVGHEIEQRPLAAALGAFGVGFVLGLLLSGRRS